MCCHSLFCVCSEKVHGVHQLPSPAGDEEWKIRPGIQAVPEDDPSGKSQAGHLSQQLPCPQVYKERLQAAALTLNFMCESSATVFVNVVCIGT